MSDKKIREAGDRLLAGEVAVGTAFEDSFKNVFGEPKTVFTARLKPNTGGNAGFREGLQGVSSALTAVQLAGMAMDSRAVSSVLSDLEELRGLDKGQYMSHITKVVGEATQFMALLVTVRGYIDHPTLLKANEKHKERIEQAIDSLYSRYQANQVLKAREEKMFSGEYGSKPVSMSEGEVELRGLAFKDRVEPLVEPRVVPHWNDSVEPVEPVKPLQ